MQQRIGDIISIVAGLYMVFFHRSLAHQIIERQNKFWGFQFGDRDIKNAGYISIIVGVGFIAIGLLSFFHVIKSK